MQPPTMPASGECIMTLDGHEDWVRWDRTGVFHIGETFRLRFGGGESEDKNDQILVGAVGG